MFWYEADVLDAERRRHGWSGNSRPVVFYGSSSLRLWTTAPLDLAPWPILNLAFGGSTIAACAWFYDRLLHGISARALVLYAGDNDLGDGRHPEEVINQFELIARRWHASHPGVPLLLLAIKPSPARIRLLDAIRYCNHRLEERCASLPDCYFVDVSQPLLAGGEPDGSRFESDRLHLNDYGYQVWAPIVRAELAARVDTHL